MPRAGLPTAALCGTLDPAMVLTSAAPGRVERPPPHPLHEVPSTRQQHLTYTYICYVLCFWPAGARGCHDIHAAAGGVERPVSVHAGTGLSRRPQPSSSLLGQLQSVCLADSEPAVEPLLRRGFMCVCGDGHLAAASAVTGSSGGGGGWVSFRCCKAAN